ncbi:MAG: tRNA guanosine(34) transglycosylase Tgt [Acidimicrobiales bacterium]
MGPMRVSARFGAARSGTVALAGGSFDTPCFMPVGTRGTVKDLASEDMDGLGAAVVLANTYHLMLRPGAEEVAALGGVRRWASLEPLVLTDSGGYQVMSLSGKVDAEGVWFRSVYDGSPVRLTPETAVAIQGRLGSDIQMALDVCPALPAPIEEVTAAATTTLRWAERAAGSPRPAGQALFGIVQGGASAELRGWSARQTAGIGFDGYGIGGLAVGETRAEMLVALAGALAELPEDRPRYLMGVGDPVGMLEAVSLGVDMFDCVLPTRLARHGTALTSAGRVSLKAAAMKGDGGPLDAACGCRTCSRYSRAYLRHLLVVGERVGGRLVSWHNLSFLIALMARAREAIALRSLPELVEEVALAWDRPAMGGLGARGRPTEMRPAPGKAG